MSVTSAASSRVLRSGSRARSDAGAGLSVAAPRSVAPARSTRGRGSRRGGSPAVAADVPDDDQPELNPITNQAYGTLGKAANAQIQSSRMGMQKALDPIEQAVLGAQASGNRPRDTATDLPPVDEEDEDSLAGYEPTVEPFSPQFVQPAERQNQISNWAVGLPQIGSRDGYTFTQGLRDGRGGLTSVKEKSQWAWHVAHVMFDAVKTPIMTLFLLWLCLYLFNGTAPASYVQNFGKSFGIGLPANGTHHTVTNMEYNNIQRRLDRVEQNLHDVPRKSITSANPPPIQHRVNWFMPGFGASIDVELSSPTAAICDPTWKPWPFSRLLKHSCPELPLSPPQKMALQTWDDPAQDRWCAPRSGGKLQLAIEIPRKILPTELVVEYMAKDASPTGYMNSAPREVELWVRIADDDVRAKVSAAINERYPELWEDANLQGRVLHVARDLGREYVPVGRWEYNIWQQENVQGFRIPGPLLNYNFSTDKFAIRVNSNWGNVGFTCINQFRMYGLDKSGIMDDLEDDPFKLAD